MDKRNYVWAFKYAPQKINDLILLDRIKQQIDRIIETKELPDMLFYGPPGVGKSALCETLIKELDADALFVNGSKDTSIDVVRNDISSFIGRMSDKQIKIVYIDEMDRISGSFADALKAEITNSTSFLFTTNHIEKISEPLKSRCRNGISFYYNKEEKKELGRKYVDRCCQILDYENVQYEKIAVAKVAQSFFPDLRNTIHNLQDIYQQNGKIDSGFVERYLSINLNEFFKLLKTKNFPNIRNWIANSHTNYNMFYSSIVNKVEEYVGQDNIIDCIDSCYKHMVSGSNAADPQLAFTHFCVEMMNMELK